MIHKAYIVYDSKALYYSSPFFMKSKGEAIRAFTESANDPTHTFGKYPADFTLFETGEFDDQVGVFEQYEAHHSLGTAMEFVARPDKPNLERVS